MRYLVFALAMLLGPVLSARAQISVDIGIPGVNIGINMPVYPHLVLIPGYPVYYDPDVASNYFFYDGLYWDYQGDNWYSSTWYNGPWELVEPEYVPQFVLLVPVRYYRAPPVYFRSWSRDGPPRWGEHWGPSWEQRRSGWDRWDRRSAPAAAPLPIYQRQYSGDRYPRAVAQQQALRSQNYRYQPRDTLAKRSFERATQGQPQGQPKVQPQGQAQGQPPKGQPPGQVQAQPQGAARLRTQTQQQPVQQGALPQTEQRRLQGQQQQQQATQAHTVRPAQPAVQTPAGQKGPQERAHVEKGSLQGKGPEPKSAPKETKAASQASGPPGGGAQNHAGPQNRGVEKKAAPQEAKGGPQGNGGNEKRAGGGGQGKGGENNKDKKE